MSSPDSAAPQHPPPPHVIHVATPQNSGLGAIALMVGIVLIAGIALLFFWSMTQNRSQPSPLQTQGEQGDIAALSDRLASDEARIATLERSPPGEVPGMKASLDQTASDLAALSARVGKLETAPDPQAAARLDDLERRLAQMRSDYDASIAVLERNAAGADLQQRQAALTSAQAALDARVAKLEAIDPSATMRRAAAELALVNLVAASGTPQPFASELETFRALMPDAPELGELAPIALSGAPTQAVLSERFAGMAAKALAAERAGAAKGFFGRLWANISNIVVIRKVGETGGHDSDSILARAGARLDKGDLAGAVEEMTALKGSARASASPWLGEAKARLAIQRDTASLARHMAELLAKP
jgi:hypothetical protein